jgi:hypothetical protein
MEVPAVGVVDGVVSRSIAARTEVPTLAPSPIKNRIAAAHPKKMVTPRVGKEARPIRERGRGTTDTSPRSKQQHGIWAGAHAHGAGAW